MLVLTFIRELKCWNQVSRNDYDFKTSLYFFNIRLLVTSLVSPNKSYLNPYGAPYTTVIYLLQYVRTRNVVILVINKKIMGYMHSSNNIKCNIITSCSTLEWVLIRFRLYLILYSYLKLFCQKCNTELSLFISFTVI